MSKPFSVKLFFSAVANSPGSGSFSIVRGGLLLDLWLHGEVSLSNLLGGGVSLEPLEIVTDIC